MSDTITQAYVETYRDNIFIQAQQRGSVFRPLVRTEMINAMSHFFERLAPTVAAKQVSRAAPTPLTNSQHSRRRVQTARYQWADIIDLVDKSRMLIDPESEYVMAAAWALGRALDDVIITAFDATAATGQDGSGTAAFDSTNMQIAADGTVGAGGGTAAGLTIDKLRTAKRILDTNNVVGEGRNIAISPIALQDLLETTEVTSSDYNTIRALVNGELNTYLGFMFHMSTRLPLSGNNRTCFFWQSDSMGLAIAQDMQTFVDRRPDLQHATQVYAAMDFGAVRLEEESVGRIIVDESV